jgi:uncharacterized protein (TIGR03435 family)
MLLIKRFVACLFVTASAFAWAQLFATIDVKSAGSVDPQSVRVRVLPKRGSDRHFGQCKQAKSEGYSVPANPSERLSTLAPWVYSEKYDIKAPSTAKQMNLSDGNTSKLVRDMFRQVLADGFHLVMQTENRTMPLYALVVARGGLKLQQSNLSHCIFDTAQDGCHRFLRGFGHPLNQAWQVATTTFSAQESKMVGSKAVPALSPNLNYSRSCSRRLWIFCSVG